MQDYLEELLDQPLMITSGAFDTDLEQDDDIDEYVEV